MLKGSVSSRNGRIYSPIEPELSGAPRAKELTILTVLLIGLHTCYIYNDTIYNIDLYNIDAGPGSSRDSLRLSRLVSSLAWATSSTYGYGYVRL